MLSIARIFVHLGCSNKIPEIRWLINNRDPFLTVLGDHKLRSGCQRGVSSVFWVADFRPCPSVAEGARELSGGPFIRALIPLLKAPSSAPNHFPKAPLPNTTTLDVRFSTGEFGGGDTNIQTVATSNVCYDPRWLSVESKACPRLHLVPGKSERGPQKGRVFTQTCQKAGPGWPLAEGGIWPAAQASCGVFSGNGA